jgi:hypothetical protein
MAAKPSSVEEMEDGPIMTKNAEKLREAPVMSEEKCNCNEFYDRFFSRRCQSLMQFVF